MLSSVCVLVRRTPRGFRYVEPEEARAIHTAALNPGMIPTSVMAQRCAGDLDHLDAAFRLFDPNYDVAAIKPKSYSAGTSPIGQVGEDTVDSLRQAKEPKTTWTIARHLRVERGQNTVDDVIVKTYSRRGGALLQHYRERGTVRSMKDPRSGPFGFGK
ncbi:MAG: hypothetical protein WA459_23425 [Stellaceae bacterium]